MKRLITILSILSRESTIFAVALLASLPTPLHSQQNADRAHPEREIRAVRTLTPIQIDAVLSEKVWKTPGYSDFTQTDPIDGAPATQRTEVWVAYDDDALYVAARLYDTAPDSIVGRLARRDGFSETDNFGVPMDLHHDHRSGFWFMVTPAGAIADGTISNDEQFDAAWDGVWDSAARTDELGWAVEMRIPYSQLRFPQREAHVWGINFLRWVQRNQERSQFVWIPKDESGRASRMAHLVGIEAINPPRRVEFLPYLSGDSELTLKEDGNPFNDGSEFSSNFGLDLKMGFGSNLTLDATFRPDFGQAEVDPAVVNLTAFETFFAERRPFFIEGANIFDFGKGGANKFFSFNWSDPNFLFSRRIGRVPQVESSHVGDFTDSPTATTILGAAKITGKITEGWSLGALDALTAREYALADSSGERFKDEVEPLTHYTVLRTQREFKGGFRGLGLISTSVLRDLRTQRLRNTLTDRALVLGLDGWTFIDSDREWVVSGWVGASRVTGSTDVITDLQRASQRYYQRPDADHLSLDSSATSLSGWAGGVMLNKQKGNKFLNAALRAISPGLETNDVGFQTQADIVNAHLVIGYRWFNPGPVFRTKNFNLATFRNYDFGGNEVGEGYFLFYGAQLLNYWGFEGRFTFFPTVLDNRNTRGGSIMKNPAFVGGGLSISTDSRKPVVWELGGFSGRRISEEGFRRSHEVKVTFKPNSQLEISINPEYTRERTFAQWVDNFPDTLAVNTFRTRQVFGQLDQTTVSMNTRLNWSFTPKLSLQLFAQPLLSTGDFNDFKELASPGTFNFQRYRKEEINLENDTYTIDPDGDGEAPFFTFENPDFNFKSLRGNVVLRWEYQPGSVFFLVWTHDRSDEEISGNFRFRRDLDRLLHIESDNLFLAKFTYWWNP